MSKGLRARIEGPSWQGIPCHDAPVTFGAHVTRVTISVSEQTECGQVVSHVLVLHGCILGSRLPFGGGCVEVCPGGAHIVPVMQCTIEVTDQVVGTADSFVLGVRVWGEVVKK